MHGLKSHSAAPTLLLAMAAAVSAVVAMLITLAASPTTGVLLLALLVLILGLSAVAAFITKVLTDDGDEPVESDPAPGTGRAAPAAHPPPPRRPQGRLTVRTPSPMISALVFGLIIGLILGMVGGGGAVLAVPVLVYAVGLGVHEATTASLAVVAAGAATGAVGQARRGAVCWTSAAWFAAAASLGSIAGTIANRALGGAALLLLFSAVMLLAARATWQRAGSPACAAGGCPSARARVLVPAGLLVGVLTGLVGVGGGFVVVPALAIGLSFGMREAMGTSMVIVAIVSVCGLVAHVAAGSSLDVPIAAAMGGAAVTGALVGPRLADRISTRMLGQGFAVLVVIVALGVAGATIAGVSV